MALSIKIGAAAALGACCRYLLGLIVPAADGLAALLLVNTLGCLLMGWAKPGPIWGTGFLGGFTTYSTFLVAIVTGHWWVLPAGTVCALAAWWLGDSFAHPRSRSC